MPPATDATPTSATMPASKPVNGSVWTSDAWTGAAAGAGDVSVSPATCCWGFCSCFGLLSCLLS